MHNSVLDGIRVLDLTRLLPGPFATQILADLGADVIKVEDAASGDYMRNFAPTLSDGQSIMFHVCNRGKKSVVLDFRKHDDLEAFLRLVDSADVVIEGFRPGVLGKFSLSPQELLQRKPSLVVCSLTGYGQAGPYVARAGHDNGYLALAGVLGSLPNPQLPPLQIADLAGGAWPATTQILAGLYRKQRTGKGCYIDVSMMDNAFALNVFGNSYAMAGAGVPSILTGALPSYQVYNTKDGSVALGALEPQFWAKFLKCIDAMDLYYSAGLEASADGDAARQRIADILATKTSAEWTVIFGDQDVCCEIIKTPAEAAQDPHVIARDLFVNVTLSDGSTVRIPKTPLRMDGVVWQNAPAPTQGQHSDSILSTARARL